MSDKSAYLNKLEAQIQEAQGVLDKLKVDCESLSKQAQREEIDRLEQHLADAQFQFQDLANVAEEAWHDLKDGLDKLLHDLGESIQTFLYRS